MHGTTTRDDSRERQEASPTQNANDDGLCGQCGAPADGYDAERKAPSCRWCAENARLVTDGGQSIEDRLERAKQAEREVAAIRANQRQADALARIAEAMEQRNALKRFELHTELEARADYATNPDTVKENIRDYEREYLNVADSDSRRTVDDGAEASTEGRR